MNKIATLALVTALLVPCLAHAQDQGPDPAEVKKKVIEIERLMKSAEEALARSTDTRSAEEKSAEAARKMLDDKARQETGKSSEELRKLAESGSKDAAETLDRLTKAANEQCKKAAEKMSEVLGTGGGGGGSGGSGGAGKGIRELIEKIRGQGQGASQGIKWLLEKTTKGQQQGGGGGDGKPQKQPDAKDEKKPDDKKPEQKPKDDNKKPESKTEPPRTPEFEQWYAELPPQVRKAYDSQDWDSIPPKWRELLKAWTIKMAEDLEKERR